jgi:CubicO group peptidase (beta-lactamase class C family)
MKPMIDLQQRIQSLLDRLVAEGQEYECQAAAYIGGKLVVDAWAGPAGSRIDGDTLIPIWSTTKGLAATAVHRLVERGVLSWDDPIAQWWPEFAARGKGGITLRHALAHTAGLAAMPERQDMAAICDWDDMCRFLAGATPVSAPGETQAYHAITYGWLIGETCRRADGRDFARIVREEICDPIGVPSPFWDGRTPVLTLDVPPPGPAGEPNPAIPPWVCPLEALINRDDVKRACLAASNGVSSARSLAKHYAALIGDGVDGIRLLRPETVRAATRREIPTGANGAAAGPRGLGYGLYGGPEDHSAAFGHGGFGGSNAFADTRLDLGFGFTCRRMQGAPDTSGLILAEIRAALGAPSTNR